MSKKRRLDCSRPNAQTKLEDCLALVGNAKNIVVFCGAGISVSAGVPDFRSSDGIYSMVQELRLGLSDPQEVFDIECFRETQIPFYKIANKILIEGESGKREPTKVHKFMKQLENEKRLLRCYTQNIDGLEEAAGTSKKFVKYCHGSFSAGAKCLLCKFKVKSREEFIRRVLNASTASIKHNDDSLIVPRCSNPECQGPLKPNITFFGEKISNNIAKSLLSDQKKVDLLLVIGTSLKVSPMKNIIDYFNHVPQILINKEHVRVEKSSRKFDFELLGKADDVVGYLSKNASVPPLPYGPGMYTFDFNQNDFQRLKIALEKERLAETKRQKNDVKDEVVAIEKISCDLCSRSISNVNEGFSCSICFGFDICLECYRNSQNLEQHKKEYGSEHIFIDLKI